METDNEKHTKKDSLEYEHAVRCRKCKAILHGKNAEDVGYCLPCFAEMMSDEEE